VFGADPAPSTAGIKVMNTHNLPGKLRKLAFAVGIALGLLAAAASVIVAAPPASVSTRFVDHGGRILSAARVYSVYWGRYWAPGRVASPTPDQITHALRTVLAGSYLAGLAQYRTIGPAVLHGSHVITTSDPSSRFTDRDIEAFLNTLFDAGILPARDEQAVYVVTIPPGIYSGEGDDLHGEHNYYQRGGHRVHYAWITDSVALEGATQTTTHEIVESLTDPEGTAILGTPGTCDGERWCEIADICSNAAKLNGVMVAPYWSNIAGRCVIPAPFAFATSEHRLPGFAASPSRSALAIAAEGVSARLWTTDERRNRAAKRRARKRRAATRELATRRGAATKRPPARALHGDGMWPSLWRATSATPDPQPRNEQRRRRVDDTYRGDSAPEIHLEERRMTHISGGGSTAAAHATSISAHLGFHVRPDLVSEGRSPWPTPPRSPSWDDHQHPACTARPLDRHPAAAVNGYITRKRDARARSATYTPAGRWSLPGHINCGFGASYIQEAR
jgi:hypothetical protein